MSIDPSTFLSGDAGDVTDPWRVAKRRAGEVAYEALDLVSGTRRRAARLAANTRPLEVLVLGIYRLGSLMPAALPALRSTRHRVTIALGSLPDEPDDGLAGVTVLALGIALVSSLIFGLAPALRASRTDLQGSLKDGARHVGASRGQDRVRPPEGERYERDVVRRALVLFNGGQGGAPDQPEVQRRVSVLLQSLLAEDILAAEADPTLADLLWWKGDRVAVVEIAVQVNGEDVRRAVQRAKTLQQGGAQAMAMVIGESWATPDTRERARTLGIDW